MELFIVIHSSRKHTSYIQSLVTEFFGEAPYFSNIYVRLFGASQQFSIFFLRGGWNETVVVVAVSSYRWFTFPPPLEFNCKKSINIVLCLRWWKYIVMGSVYFYELPSFSSFSSSHFLSYCKFMRFAFHTKDVTVKGICHEICSKCKKLVEKFMNHQGMSHRKCQKIN